MNRRRGGAVSAWADIGRSVFIGEGARIWAFTVIEDSVSIGAGCVVGSHCFIGSGSRIGNGSRLQTGVFLPRGTLVEENVFIGPHVVMTDDKAPMIGGPYDARPPVIRAGASIGAGAIILPGVEIGPNCMIGAGAVVTRDVPGGETVVGLPARPQSNGHAVLSERPSMPPPSLEKGHSS